jgi:hypothetical protein
VGCQGPNHCPAKNCQEINRSLQRRGTSQFACSWWSGGQVGACSASGCSPSQASAACDRCLPIRITGATCSGIEKTCFVLEQQERSRSVHERHRHASLELRLDAETADCIAHSTQHTAHSSQLTAHSTQHTAHSTQPSPQRTTPSPAAQQHNSTQQHSRHSRSNCFTFKIIDGTQPLCQSPGLILYSYPLVQLSSRAAQAWK